MGLCCVKWYPPALKHRLKTDAANVGKLEAEFDGLPEKGQIFLRHRHRQRDRQLDFATAFDGPPSRRAQVRPAQGVLAVELRAVELEIELKLAAAGGSRQPGKELFILCDANAIGVEQKVIDARVLLDPFDEFKEFRMQRRLAARELQDFNSTFAIHDALNAPLQIFQRHGVHVVACAHRRIGVAGRTTQIARVDDFDERQAGGKLFKRRVAPARDIASESARGRSIGRAARRAAATAACIFRIPLRKPIKPRVRRDARRCFPVRGTGAFEKDFRGPTIDPPHLRRTRCVADRTAAGGVLEELFGRDDWEERGFHGIWRPQYASSHAMC